MIVLHGGASRKSSPRVSPTQLSVLRMIPIAKRIARDGGGQLEVFRLLNSRRGWDASHTPVVDVRWALDQLRERAGRTLPTCLVGHSLGGRAALFSADQPEVRSVVALAPWVTETDTPTAPRRRVLIVHGSRDRIASPGRSAALADRMRVTADVEYVSVEGGKHAMLSHHGEFSGRAAAFASKTLARRDAHRSPRPPTDP